MAAKRTYSVRLEDDQRRQLEERSGGIGLPVEVLLIGGLNDAQTVDSSSGFSFLPSSWAARSGTKLHTDLVLILSAQVPRASEKR